MLFRSKFTEQELEQIMDLPPNEQYVIYSQKLSVDDMDTMDRLEAAGAFNPRRLSNEI